MKTTNNKREDVFREMVEISEIIAEQFGSSLNVHIAPSKLIIKNETLWNEFEFRPDGSYRVMTYFTPISEGEKTWVPKVYLTTNSKETAIDCLLDFLTSEPNSDTQLELSEMKTIPFGDVIGALVDAGATFVTVPEEQLYRFFGRVLFHTPPGTDLDSVQATIDSLNEYDGVTLDSQLLSVNFSHISHTEIHNHRRVGLFSQYSKGVSSISVNDGVENAREFIKSDAEPTPEPSATVNAEKLIRELSNAGAVVIAVEPLLSNNDQLTVKAWLPAATGYDVVGSYKNVKIGQEVLDLNWEFVSDSGPDFLNRVPIYSENTTHRSKSVGISDGVSNLESYVEDGCPRSATSYSSGGEA